MIRNHTKVAGCKLNTQKSIAFLYTIHEQVEFDIKDTMPFTLVLAKMKHMYKSNKIWINSVWGKFIPYLRECKMVQPVLNTKYMPIIWSGNSASCYLPKGVENLCFHKTSALMFTGALLSPRFLKVLTTPLCFYQRLTSVPVFTDQIWRGFSLLQKKPLLY